MISGSGRHRTALRPALQEFQLSRVRVVLFQSPRFAEVRAETTLLDVEGWAKDVTLYFFAISAMKEKIWSLVCMV